MSKQMGKRLHVGQINHKISQKKHREKMVSGTGKEQEELKDTTSLL